MASTLSGCLFDHALSLSLGGLNNAALVMPCYVTVTDFYSARKLLRLWTRKLFAVLKCAWQK